MAEGKFTSFSLSRIVLAVSTLLTFVGFIVIVIGVSELQKKLADVNIRGAYVKDPKATQALVDAYTVTMTSANYVNYPLAPGYQFGLAWWIIFGELPVWVLTAFLLAFPKFVHSARLAVVSWVASFQVAVWYHINTLLYLSRSPIATGAFGASKINTALAGAFLVAIGNALTVTSLSLWRRHDGDTSAPKAIKHAADVVNGKPDKLGDVNGTKNGDVATAV